MRKLLTDEALFDPPYLIVRPSPIGGLGLFTTKACLAGEALMVIAGEVIGAAECRRREIQEGNCYIYYHGDDCYIDPGATKSRYLNHSCEPNALPETRDPRTLFLLALCDIATGQEITIDYEYDEIYDLCRAANPLCRRADCLILTRKGAC
jgi:SET domain-containing protein